MSLPPLPLLLVACTHVHSVPCLSRDAMHTRQEPPIPLSEILPIAATQLCSMHRPLQARARSHSGVLGS